MAELPLKGLRVIELARILAGPWVDEQKDANRIDWWIIFGRIIVRCDKGVQGWDLECVP